MAELALAKAATMGPSSREGSSTTAAPVQVSRVGTATEVVLKPPDPAKTRAWVGPVRQGSTSSGAVPPWPQLRGSAGSKAPRAPGPGRPVGLADDDAAEPGSGPGKRRRASRMASQSAWPSCRTGADERGPVGGAEALADVSARTPSSAARKPTATAVGDRGVEGADEVDREARPR